MKEILNRTLKTIEKERGKFDKSLDLVDELLNDFGEENLADKLYSEIDDEVAWENVADLFGILIWSTSDNGHALTNTTESWIIECQNERKISIALNLDVFPFLDSEEMCNNLMKVTTCFPSLKARCNYLIETRFRQNA